MVETYDVLERLIAQNPGMVRAARTNSPKKAIRLFCLECMGGSPATVKDCADKICPLWPYRFGAGFEDPGLPIPEKVELTEEEQEELRKRAEHMRKARDKSPDKLIVCTSTIKYKGDDKLDVSVKSGEGIFAPTWEMVNGHKNGTLSDDDYTQQYNNKMRKSFVDNHDSWMEIIKRDRVVLCCYCKPGEFCHRVLLKKLLEKVCAQNNVEFVDGGEV